MTSLYSTSGTPVSLWTTAGVPVFWKPDSGPIDDPADTSMLTTHRQIANNTGYYRLNRAVAESGSTVITEHDVRSTANRLSLQWTNIHSSTDTTIARAGFVISGTYHPALFDGQESATLAPGTMVRSDPTRDDVVIYAGSTIHSVVELASGTFGRGTLSSESQISSVTSGRFDGTIPPMSSNLISNGLSGLYGHTVADEAQRATSVVFTGDSFMDRCWGSRGAERHGLAWSDWSVWLDATHISRDPSVDKALLDRIPPEGDLPYDVAFIGWGGNDRGQALDIWLERTIKSWRFFQSMGCRIATKTLHPYTNSIDNWSTIEGQTLKYASIEGNRTYRNDWLRDGAPLDPTTDEPGETGTTDGRFIRQGHPDHALAYPVFDEADTCETERNSGLWKFDGGQWTTDGAHLTGHGNARMADAFTQWVADNLT